MRLAMLHLLKLLTTLFRCIPAFIRSRTEQALVKLALRQQLATYAHQQTNPKLTPIDRAFWVALSLIWPRWKKILCSVQPETVVRWHRKGFALYWRSISKPGPGRPSISPELQALIRRLATENPWRAGRIQAELETLGIHVSLATVSRYLPKKEPNNDQRQRWITFLRNHRDVIAAMDFLVVPTARFKLLYVWFVIGHGRREILHVDVTAHPTASWVMQQLRETFPGDTAIKYMIYDNDSIFSNRVDEVIARFGIEPKTTSFRSPWQNGLAERWVGTVKRDRLDHVVVIDERHLQRLLHEYVDYYNTERVHTVLRDSPTGRPSESPPESNARVIGRPRLGGLPHRYAWSEAA
jgi:putative transposase